MANEFIGKGGLVTLGAYGTGVDINVTKWTITHTSEKHDVTAMSTAAAPYYKTFLGGINSWSGTVEGFTSSGVVPDETALDNTPAGAPASVTFSDGNHDFVGKIHLSEITYENDANSVTTFTANFIGEGALSIA